MELMTLDEAIKRAEEVAEEQEKLAKEWHENQVRKCELIPFAKMDYTHENECKECASQHRQLAKWLKDYKRLLKQKSNLMHREILGYWIVKDYYTKMGEHYKGYECPVCHKEYNLKTNFCPNCGNRNGE